MEANPQITILVALVGFVGAVFGAIFSFVGVAITAFFTSRNNNKNIFINTVTNERAKWRDELRRDTAEFCRLVYGELQGKTGTDPLKREELRVAIRLRLNPNPEHRLDKAILDSMSRLAKSPSADANVDVRGELEVIESNVQALLKQEWEKSKEEARKGRLLTKPKSA